MIAFLHSLLPGWIEIDYDDCVMKTPPAFCRRVVVAAPGTRRERAFLRGVIGRRNLIVRAAQRR